MNNGRTLIKALAAISMVVILFAGLYPKDFNFIETIGVAPENGLQGKHYTLAETPEVLSRDTLSRLNSNGFGVNMTLRPPAQYPDHFMVLASITTGDSSDQFLIGQWLETIIVMAGNDFPNKAGVPRLQINTEKLPKPAPDSPLQLQFRLSPGETPARAEVYHNGDRVVNYTEVYALLPSGADNTTDNPNASITFTNTRNREHGWPGTLQRFELFESGENGDATILSYDFTTDPISIDTGNSNLADESADKTQVNLLANYQIREPRFLKESTGYFSNGKRSLIDIVLNFVGFIPLGLLLAVLVRKYNGRTMSVFLATAAGLAASLLIEFVQGLMPSRDSTFFDVLFNSAGAFYGGLLGLLFWWMARSRTQAKEQALANEGAEAYEGMRAPDSTVTENSVQPMQTDSRGGADIRGKGTAASTSLQVGSNR